MRRPAWVAYIEDRADDQAAEAAADGQGGTEHQSAGRAVLLHLPRGERVALSGTATRVWQLIVAAGEEGARMGDFVPLLAAEYDADPTIVDHDVAALLEQLAAGEWVETVPLSDQGFDEGPAEGPDEGPDGGPGEGTDHVRGDVPS